MNCYFIFVKILSKKAGDICECLWLSCRRVLEDRLNYKTAPGCPRSHCLDQYATLITMSFLWTISLLPSKVQTLLCQMLENYLKTQLIDLKEENARCLSMIDINARAHKEIKLTVGGLYTEKLKSPGTGSTEGIYNVYVHS